MSYEYDALHVIRRYSMPIHKKLDGIGISTHLRNGTLDSSSYLKWLTVTYKFIAGYESLVSTTEYIDLSISSFTPDNLFIDSIVDDIRTLDPLAALPAPDKFPSISKHQLTLVPVYTLLGSLMGTQIIYNHVKKITPAMPTAYLNGILKNIGKWSQFKDSINTMEMNITEQELGNYTNSFWEVVYDGYSDIFKD